jgi:hypothetical protein
VTNERRLCVEGGDNAQADFIHERRPAEFLTVVTGVAIPEMDA